eukprot:TRINITY_DN3183_c0_g1_i11.p1 TRINITY_DN3183_c0_g1~~TRINITY_DN3183_c0_g1_i11.p1  ORF type:complete len:253 (+),score=40.84 TRINITY_DN3183_c0_g1_i11:70-828(+)
MYQQENITGQCLMLPSFLRKLANPSIRTVMLCGCGGGFDFVHSMNLYPELKRLQKKIIITSYSFVNVGVIQDAPVVWSSSRVVAKLVSANSVGDPYYKPEIGVAQFLDSTYPEEAPHHIITCNARSFTVPLLHDLYSSLVEQHEIDCIILFDGGTDSLMKGDEEGLGDPIEDCVSITAVSRITKLKEKILVSTGFGADRFNHVSDCSSLRAVAELTRIGGFLGSVSLEPDSPGFNFYCRCVKHLYEVFSFRR